jgi:hypothetical protein
METNNFEKTAEQAAAFQKIWMESASKMIQAGLAMGPNSAPPEVLRQLRSGMFQALAESWEEFMRSPQFLEGMKQWMETAVAFRKITSEFLAKARNEMQAPSRDDVDTIMLNIRHIEKRLLDRIEELSQQVRELKQAARTNPRQATTKAPRSRPSRPTRKAGAA